MPRVPSPGACHRSWEQEDHASAHHQRELLSPLDPIVGERSRTDVRYHNFIARRSEFGIAAPLFSPLSTMAWLRMPTLRRACVPANCDYAFFPVARRCPRPSTKTESSGGPTPWLFWSHPYEIPQLRRSSSPVVPLGIRAARSRRLESALPAASKASRLGCWAPQLTTGQRSDAGATPLARASTTQRAWSTSTSTTLACGALAHMENVLLSS